MRRDEDTSQTRETHPQPDGGEEVLIIFVNGVKHELNPDDEFTASDLIERAGDDPSDHTLVATKGESGKDDKVFDDDEVVDFDGKHRKHFETKATGDTFI